MIKDAPSPSNSQTTPETPPLVIPTYVKEDNHDIEFAHMGNDPYFGIQIPEVSSDQSSSSDIIHIIVPPDHPIYKVKLDELGGILKNKARGITQWWRNPELDDETEGQAVEPSTLSVGLDDRSDLQP
ncbi:hypothetical protein Tco_0467769 [Tanacetum coccineum]